MFAHLGFSLPRAQRYIRLVGLVSICSIVISVLIVLSLRLLPFNLLGLTTSGSGGFTSTLVVTVIINLCVSAILSIFLPAGQRESLVAAILMADKPAFKTCPFCGYPPDPACEINGCAVCPECGRPYSLPYADALPKDWRVQGARSLHLDQLIRSLKQYRTLVMWIQGRKCSEFTGGSSIAGALRQLLWMMVCAIGITLGLLLTQAGLSYIGMHDVAALLRNDLVHQILFVLALSDLPVAFILARWLRAKQRQIELISEERYVRALTAASVPAEAATTAKQG